MERSAASSRSGQLARVRYTKMLRRRNINPPIFRRIPVSLLLHNDRLPALEQVSIIAREILLEVRTPLASIEGAASILEEGSKPEKSNAFIEIIVSECKRVNRLLSDISESTEIIPLACRATMHPSFLGRSPGCRLWNSCGSRLFQICPSCGAIPCG